MLSHLLLALFISLCRGDSSVGTVRPSQTDVIWSNTSYVHTTASSTADLAAEILAGLGDSSTSLLITSDGPTPTSYASAASYVLSPSSPSSSNAEPTTTALTFSSDAYAVASGTPNSEHFPHNVSSLSNSSSTHAISESSPHNIMLTSLANDESSVENVTLSSHANGNPSFDNTTLSSNDEPTFSNSTRALSATEHNITRYPSTTGLSRPTISGAALRNNSIWTNESIVDCQAALVSWSMATSKAYLPAVTTSTVWFTRILHVTQAYGHADVYTTSDGFARAPNLTITSRRNFTYPQYSVQYYVNSTVTVLTSSISIPPKPACTIDVLSCAALYSSYAKELGVTDTAVPWVPHLNVDEPKSPRCLQTTDGPVCITRPVHFSTTECAVSAHSVHLYYWPPTSVAPNATTTHTPTTVHKGITMVSPSIYLSFDSVGAAEGYGAAYVTCEGRSWPTYSMRHIGSENTGHWLSMHPHSVSTLEKAIDETFLYPSAPYWTHTTQGPKVPLGRIPDAAITAMANQNASDYSFWAQVIYSASANFTAYRINLDHLTRPDARAYYLRPFAMSLDEKYARGCHPQGAHPSCNTIFDDEYRAQISVPAELLAAHPDWARCRPSFWGVYDPPEALRGGSDAAAPAETTSSSAPTPTPATPASVVQDPTPTPTANKNVGQPDPAPGKTSQDPPVLIANRPTDSPVDQSTPNADRPPPNNPAATTSNAAADPANSPPRSQTQVLVFTPEAPQQPPPANALEALTQLTPKQSSPAVAVFTVGASTITATSNSGAIIIGTNTIASGQVLTIGGAELSNTGSAVVVNHNAGAPAPLGTVGTQPIVPNPSGDGWVIGSQTITSGTQTIGDVVVQVTSNRLLVGTSIIPLPPSPVAIVSSPPVVINAASPVATISGTPVVADPVGDGFLVGSHKIAPGRQTINGVVVEAASDRLVIGSSTINVQRPTFATIAGTPVVSNPSGLVVGSQTITTGLQTINNIPISLDATALVIGSSTIALATAIATLAGAPVVANPSGVWIGTQFVSKGSQTTIAGVAVNVATDSIVIGSQTFALSALATIAGQTIVANPSGIVIGGKTLTPGDRTTIAGTPISVASNGVVVGSSTIAVAKPFITPLITTIAGTVVSAGDSRIVLGGSTTLSRGQSVTIDGTVVGLSTNGLVMIVSPTGSRGDTTRAASTTSAIPASVPTSTPRPTGSATRSIPSIAILTALLCVCICILL